MKYRSSGHSKPRCVFKGWEDDKAGSIEKREDFSGDFPN